MTLGSGAPSRLSSLLVRDGVVGVKRLEQAYQRQVIYGGALDTNLLEMGVITEEQAATYLSLSAGIPAADRDLLEYFDPRAVQICPREVADAHHVAPVAFAGEALRVVTMDPVDFASLESLATVIATPVQPFVVPELRFCLLMERLFGTPAPPRFAALAARLAARLAAPPTPSERGSVTAAVQLDPNAHKAAKVSTEPMTTDALARSVEKNEQQRRAQVRPPSAPPPVALRAAPVALPEIHDGTPGTPSASSEAITPRLPRGQQQALAEASAVVRKAWRGGLTVDPRPLDPRAAADQLQHADDRDAIFATLIRGVRSRVSYAAVLVVQGEIAYGRVAIAADDVDNGVMQVAIPYTPVPAFRNAIANRSPYIGPVGTGDIRVDASLARLGGILPASALVLPIAIRDRTVALVYAHRGPDPLPPGEIADVLPLASEAAMALSRLIVRAKSEGFRKERGETAPLDAAEAPVKSRPLSEGPWARPSTGDGVPLGLDQEVAVPPAPRQVAGQSIDQILDAIEEGGPSAVDALDEAVRRVDEVLPRLRRRLPGRLWLDRYAAATRPTRASQHGPLLALTVRLGAAAAPLLLELMASDVRDLRYYATLAGSEVRAPLLIGALVARLFDVDHGVSAAAIDALCGYPPRELGPALVAVRAGLAGEPRHARAAAQALGELRDVLAIPSLIDATERDHATAEEARRALVAITRQDFGTKARKWRAWWERNQSRPRMEWLLDGLGHAEDDLRLAASEELRRLTGEYFGYHYDLPRREREEARLRWMKWWEDVGRARFLSGGAGVKPATEPVVATEIDDERNRPTAMLPPPRR